MVACRSFWKSLTDEQTATRVATALEAPTKGPDLRILALLQRDGRLVDFLLEDVDPYTDAQIGAAVRDIHRGCAKVLKEYVKISPVLPQSEGDRVTVPAGFDAGAIRLSGNVAGAPPFQGQLKHHGWKADATQLPTLPGLSADGGVLAPAEVEVG